MSSAFLVSVEMLSCLICVSQKAVVIDSVDSTLGLGISRRVFQIRLQCAESVLLVAACFC